MAQKIFLTGDRPTAEDFNSFMKPDTDGLIRLANHLKLKSVATLPDGEVGMMVYNSAEGAIYGYGVAGWENLSGGGGGGDPEQDVISYVSLAQTGTYNMVDGINGLHHIPEVVGGGSPDSVHSIDRYVNDMTSDIDAELLVPDQRFDWQERTDIGMTSPKSSDAPSWYIGEYGASPYEWCRHGLTWYVAMEGVGHTATNTRVQIRNLRCMFLSNSSRLWTEFDIVEFAHPEEWKYPFEPTYAGDGDARTESEANGGGISVKPNYVEGPDSGKILSHGYGNGHTITNPSDWRAVCVTMEFRLIKDNPAGVDDRASARFTVDCGLDYRPGWQWDPATSTDVWREWPSTYVVAAGNSRMLQATNDWRGSGLIIPAYRLGCSFSEIESNPPEFMSPSTTTENVTETTVVFPPNPTDGKKVKVVSLSTITIFTLSPNTGQSGSFVFTLTKDTEAVFRYRDSNSTWYRIL